MDSFGKEIAPMLRESGSCDSFMEQVAVVPVEGDEPVDFRNRDSVVIAFEQLESFTGLDRALLLHGKIKAAAPTQQKTFENVVALKLRRQFVARRTRLANHHDCRANLKSIPDVKVVLREAC